MMAEGFSLASDVVKWVVYTFVRARHAIEIDHVQAPATVVPPRSVTATNGRNQQSVFTTVPSVYRESRDR